MKSYSPSSPYHHSNFSNCNFFYKCNLWGLNGYGTGTPNQPLGSLNGPGIHNNNNNNTSHSNNNNSMGGGAAGPSHPHNAGAPSGASGSGGSGLPHHHTQQHGQQQHHAQQQQQSSTSISPRTFHFEGLLTGPSSGGSLSFRCFRRRPISHPQPTLLHLLPFLTSCQPCLLCRN